MSTVAVRDLCKSDRPLPATRRYPSLYQLNTRVLLSELSRTLGRRATLDDVPDAQLDWLAENGFDWVWFLGVWQTGSAGRRVSLENPEWQREFRQLLPDFSDGDVCGSCFAIRSYSVHSDFGRNDALDRLRTRLHRRGVRLLLDFVPNHMAPDHQWIEEHPEYFVHGTEAQLLDAPQNYTRVMTSGGQRILAYGRDPYFDGWPDTLQLNYAEPGLQEAMASELERIAEMCDGVRCDMAMLILPDVFRRTWGLQAAPFWPMATERTRTRHPGFLFMAEVYWDLEWTLQQQGFDYTYDKRLYDRLREGHAGPVRDHFRADMEFQRKSARFLENHDEPRAASTFPEGMYEAAAVLTFLCPGLRFFHQGQIQGYTKRIPVHLGRGPAEPVSSNVEKFYGRLLACLHTPEAGDGDWQLLECTPAWDSNGTCDAFIGFALQSPDGRLLVSVVNYAPHQSQCYLRVPLATESDTVHFQDRMSPASYVRSVDEVRARGLYLDMPAWGYHVFELVL